MQFEVLEAWEQALSMLQAHEHLSPVVQQSITALQAISSKVWEMNPPDTGAVSAAPDGHSNAFVDDLFRDMGFDPMNPPFGLEDMQWLNNFSLGP